MRMRYEVDFEGSPAELATWVRKQKGVAMLKSRITFELNTPDAPVIELQQRTGRGEEAVRQVLAETQSARIPHIVAIKALRALNPERFGLKVAKDFYDRQLRRDA